MCVGCARGCPDVPVPSARAAIVGNVNKVLTHSVVDGPGNRAVVFLQGCNLHCIYCHNPQTINLCNDCGACVPHCPAGALSMTAGRAHWDAALCRECDTCIRVCPSRSSPRARRVTAEALWRELSPLVPFLSGVTISGGEPTLQIDFVAGFLTLVKRLSSLTTLLETNGSTDVERLRRLLPVLDTSMIDLKTMDPQVHRRLTGRDNAQTLETIRFLAGHGKVHGVRVTVVPGYSDSVENATATAHFVAEVDRSIRLRFLRFRAHGTRGEAERWQSPSDELMDRLVEAARAEGILDVSRSI